MTVTPQQIEELAVKHGLSPRAARWVTGDTLADVEADILQLIADRDESRRIQTLAARGLLGLLELEDPDSPASLANEVPR